jgi:hypothetical protein
MVVQKPRTRLRSSEAVSDLGKLGRSAVLPDQQPQHTSPYVAKIRCPRCQHLVLQGREPPRLRGIGLLPGICGRRSIADGIACQVKHFRIFKQLLVCSKDCGSIRIRVLTETLLQRLQLQVGRCDRGIERTSFLMRVRCVLLGNYLLMAKLVHLTHGYAR